MKVIVYGAKGSISYSNGSEFGGNTSCMTVESCGEELVVDAGSGLYAYQKKIETGKSSQKPVNILVSHLHLDHIIGLGMFSPAWSGRKVNIYTIKRGSKPLREQVLGIFSPPYWPKSMMGLANVDVFEIFPDVSFQVGVFQVTPFLASHPDETISFHITDGKKLFVHLLDSEYESTNPIDYEASNVYYKNADLVVFDACYLPVDYHKFVGFGHSTVKHGVELARKWGVKHMMFSHFSQNYSDEEIKSLVSYFDGEGFCLARDGMELEI